MKQIGMMALMGLMFGFVCARLHIELGACVFASIFFVTLVTLLELIITDAVAEGIKQAKGGL